MWSLGLLSTAEYLVNFREKQPNTWEKIMSTVGFIHIKRDR